MDKFETYNELNVENPDNQDAWYLYRNRYLIWQYSFRTQPITFLFASYFFKYIHYSAFPFIISKHIYQNKNKTIFEEREEFAGIQHYSAYHELIKNNFFFSWPTMHEMCSESQGRKKALQYFALTFWFTISSHLYDNGVFRTSILFLS